MRALLSATIVLVAVCVARAEDGTASVYGNGDGYAGRRTASGEIMNPGARTCAHRSARFGTVVRVLNLSNNRSTTCRVNDRGPFVRGRVIDVSPRVARELGFGGLAPVRLTY